MKIELKDYKIKHEESWGSYYEPVLVNYSTGIEIFESSGLSKLEELEELTFDDSEVDWIADDVWRGIFTNLVNKFDATAIIDSINIISKNHKSDYETIIKMIITYLSDNKNSEVLLNESASE